MGVAMGDEPRPGGAGAPGAANRGAVPDVYEFRWANEGGVHGMISVDEAEYFGWEKWRQDPRYRDSWIMRRMEVTR